MAADTTTVKHLADTVGVSIDKLLAQFKEAGIHVASADQEVSETQKRALLAHLQKPHDALAESSTLKPTLVLKRTSVETSKLKIEGAAGRAKTVNVEVRRQRTMVKPDGSDDSFAAQRAAEAARAAELERLAASTKVEEVVVEAPPVVEPVAPVEVIKPAVIEVVEPLAVAKPIEAVKPIDPPRSNFVKRPDGAGSSRPPQAGVRRGPPPTTAPRPAAPGAPKPNT